MKTVDVLLESRYFKRIYLKIILKIDGCKSYQIWKKHLFLPRKLRLV